MRYYLPFLLLFLFATTNLAAQLQKGNWLVNSASGAFWESDPFAGGDLLVPNISGGYFVADRLMIGGGFNRTDFNSLSILDESRLSAYARYYIPSLKNAKLHYYAEAGIDYVLDGNGSIVPRIGLGIEYELAPGLSLNGGLSGGLTTGSSFGSSPSALGLHLGTNVLLGNDSQAAGDADYGLRKGDVLLGASFGRLTYGRLRGTDVFTGNFDFSAGLMVSDHFMLEGEVGLSFLEYDFGSEGGFTLRDGNGYASLGVRYQFNAGKRFQPYVAGGIRYDFWDYQFDWNDDSFGREDVSFVEDAISMNFKAGFLYFLNERVALDVNLGYRNTFSDFSAREGGQLTGHIGMKLFFGGKSKKRAPRR